MVAARTDGAGERWWAVSGAVATADATGGSIPRVHRLGTGTPPGSDEFEVLPPLVGTWVVRDAEDLTVDLVATPPEIDRIEVLSQDRTIDLSTGVTVIPAWEDDGERPSPSPVVVVGRTAEDVPLSPLPHP